MFSALRQFFSPKCGLCGSRSQPMREFSASAYESSTAPSALLLCSECAPVCPSCGGIRHGARLTQAGIVPMNHRHHVSASANTILSSMLGSGASVALPRLVLQAHFCECKMGACPICSQDHVAVRAFQWSSSNAGMFADGVMRMCLKCAPICSSCGGTKLTQQALRVLRDRANRHVGIQICKCREP
jgi:hypothetical protein